jgi:hypothetical protein
MNKSILFLILTSLLVALILNIILPHIFVSLMEESEKNVGDDLGFKGNFMRLMMYNYAYPVSGFFYLLLIIFFSVSLGSQIKFRPTVVKSLVN